MHFSLHGCGDNSLLPPDRIDAGLDVQHVLQETDRDGAREEVRFLIDAFDRPEDRMYIAAGNGIVAGTPIENIEAFLDEALTYGAKHRKAVTRT